MFAGVMGNLKRFYRNILRNNIPIVGKGCDRMSNLEIESHLTVATYGDFTLPEAIRPSFDLKVVPEQGYKHDCFRDAINQSSISVVIASVSIENLFETFLDLLNPLGDGVDVVLETSHRRSGGHHTDLYREGIDLPILKSFLYDYEDMILNDGCTGIAVLNPAIPAEVQFDEHKILIVYAHRLQPYEKILREHHVVKNEHLRLLTEAEHVHTTRDEYLRLFDGLQTMLGIDEECAAMY
jgi:hypothetical protein